MTYHYKNTEPILSDDDNKTLQDYDILDNELLLLKVKLNLLLKIHCCRFSTIYRFTDNTLKHIQENAIAIFNDKIKNDLQTKQLGVFMVVEK